MYRPWDAAHNLVISDMDSEEDVLSQVETISGPLPAINGESVDNNTPKPLASITHDLGNLALVQEEAVGSGRSLMHVIEKDCPEMSATKRELLHDFLRKAFRYDCDDRAIVAELLQYEWLSGVDKGDRFMIY